MKTIDRFGALTGAAYVLLVGVGSTMATGPGPQPDHPTGQQVLDNLHWLTGSTTGQVGVSLELLGSPPGFSSLATSALGCGQKAGRRAPHWSVAPCP